MKCFPARLHIAELLARVDRTDCGATIALGEHVRTFDILWPEVGEAPVIPRLDFSDSANSQYLPALTPFP